MEPARQKWVARLLLLLGCAVGLGWLARLNYAEKISTNVLDLVPTAERAPELAVARELATQQQAKVALFVLEGGEPRQRDDAAARFAGSLRRSGAFSEVALLPDAAGRETLGRHVFEQRFDLLFPDWIAAREAEFRATPGAAAFPEWLAERVAVQLEQFTATPEAIAFQDLFPADPLQLVSALARQMQDLENDAEAGPVRLVWARTVAEPLLPEGQAPVFAAVDAALEEATSAAPGIRLRWTAVSRFAAENRTRIESELSTLNIVSLAAVLGVALLCLSNVWKAFHLVPVILGALLGAWVVTTAAFDRVHVLVFVVGSLLGGVAIDYGFYLYLQPPANPGEPYLFKLRRLLKPLLASAFTTVLGFSLLLWSELPMIRQLGVFVSAGLIAALVTALLWFGQRDETYTSTRTLARKPLPRGGTMRRVARALLGVAAVVAVVGCFRVRWHDDIRDLEALPAGLREEAMEVRTRFGDTRQRTTYVTRGPDVATARTTLAEFLQWHETAFPGSSVASIGMLLPVVENWNELPRRLERLRGFEPALRTALARHGFEPDGFEPFFEAWAKWRATTAPRYDALASALVGALEGPIAMGASVAPGSVMFLTVADHPPGREPPPALKTTSVDQLQSFNQLFARYRTSALKLSSIGFSLLGVSVLALYGIRAGLLVFAIPAGSCLFALGVLGLAGQPLNLFHLLGAFLGVCLSHNYAIFSTENAARHEDPPPSIRLSALTTGASFGVLAFSQIPVVSALGWTVALIVLSALAFVELRTVFGPGATKSSAADIRT